MSWYHPHAVEMAISYADDAFQLGLREISQKVLEKHLALIEAYQLDPSWNDVGSDEKAMFAEQEGRIRSLLNRLNSNEDYFGNPEGWVPALSLEANKLLFEEEVQWAIRTIFLADWIMDENNRHKDNAIALAETRSILRNEIKTLENNLSQAIERIPTLTHEAENMTVEITNFQAELQAVEQVLIERAKKIVQDRHKMPFWKKGLRTLGAMAKMAPGLEKYGLAFDLIAGFDPDEPWATINALPYVVSAFAESDVEKKAEDGKLGEKELSFEDKVLGLMEKIAAASEVEQPNELKEKLESLSTSLKPISDDNKNIKSLFGESTPKEEMEQELQKLKKSDPEFKRLTEELKSLLASKEDITKEIIRVHETVETSLAKIIQNYMNIAELLPNLENSSRVILSQKAALALKSMKSRALKRLQRYQYWVAKAYEYRTLKPFEGDLTLTNLFVEMTELVRNPLGDGRLTGDDFERLYAIYREDLSRMIDLMVENYNNFVTIDRGINALYRLSDEEVRALNLGKRISLNLWEKGLFQDEEEDVRIVSIEVESLTTSINDHSNSFAYLDIDFEHSGVSRIWRDNQVHLFQHYNKHTKKPMKWTSRFENGVITNHQISASTESLIHSILIDDDVDTMLFSRPSAWATLWISKSGNSDGDDQIDIEELAFRVTYEYVPADVFNDSWKQYRDEQNKLIGELYSEQLGRDAEREELESNRMLLDKGFSNLALSEIVGRNNLLLDLSGPVFEIISLSDDSCLEPALSDSSVGLTSCHDELSSAEELKILRATS